MLTRRDVLRYTGAGLVAGGASGWLGELAARAGAAAQARGRSLVLLWMSGGPSQLDTFDMKPGHANGGPIGEAQTSVPGVRFSEHLPRLGRHADRLAIVRSLSTEEGDHDRATRLARTGQRPGGVVAYPSIACALAKELRRKGFTLPQHVSIAAPPVAPEAFGPGLLGPAYTPAQVAAAPAQGDNGFASLRVANLDPPPGLTAERVARRRALWDELQRASLGDAPPEALAAHDELHRQALALVAGGAREAFDLSREPAKTREDYGRGEFGQGCLMARRLVERGVPVVEVALGGGLGWDTHADGFRTIERLSKELDAGWGALIEDLEARGLLDTTTILWIGEFGRTPTINSEGGRDHYPKAWSCVFAGGGVAGGQAIGRTSPDGSTVLDQPVTAADVLATLCKAVGVDPDTENITPEGRPTAISQGTPIEGVLA